MYWVLGIIFTPYTLHLTPHTLHLIPYTSYLTPTKMSFIASTAAVMGKVTLGKQVSIWYGAVLRGDTESITIGDGCNIQDNVVGHAFPGLTALLAENVTV